jgi:hypothetical protein
LNGQSVGGRLLLDAVAPLQQAGALRRVLLLLLGVRDVDRARVELENRKFKNNLVI